MEAIETSTATPSCSTCSIGGGGIEGGWKVEKLKEDLGGYI